MLRKALADGVESGESSAHQNAGRPTTSEQAVHRFEHYELAQGEDGKPVELGRGAMGVTLQGVRRRFAMSRDTESDQRTVSR